MGSEKEYMIKEFLRTCDINEEEIEKICEIIARVFPFPKVKFQQAWKGK